MVEAPLLLPSYINGQPTFLPEADPELVRLLQEGDPTIGWEGDSRLYLRRNHATGGWTVWRLGEDGCEYAICSSNAPHKLDKSLLIRLRDHDTRKVDVLKRVETQNAQAQKNKDTAEYEKHFEALEKVYWGLRRDVGHQY